MRSREQQGGPTCVCEHFCVIFIAATALAAVAAPANAHPTVRSDAVSAWNANAGKAALAACIAPDRQPASRVAYVRDDAPGHPRRPQCHRAPLAPVRIRRHSQAGTSPDAAVAAAARDVLVTLLSQIPAPFPPACVDAGVASVEADYAEALAAIPDGPAKTRGIELGQAAAAAILALRAADGSDTPLVVSDYPQGTAPGEYRFTPGTPFAFAPGWAEVTPFVLRDSSQFRPGPPYAVTSKKYAADFNEVKRLGGDGVTTPSARTAEQTEIALFWVESSPLQWNRIARTVSADTGLDLWEQARLFGLLNMALADGYVGSFETKYHYNYWRPVTAIQTADTDGNPRHQRRPELDAAGADTSDPRLRLGAQRRRWRGGQGPEAVLRHRPHRLCDLQPDAAGRKHVRRHDRRSCAATPASPRRPRRTDSRASSSASTSARRSRKGSSTAPRSAIARSTVSCDPRTDRPSPCTARPRRAGPGSFVPAGYPRSAPPADGHTPAGSWTAKCG